MQHVYKYIKSSQCSFNFFKSPDLLYYLTVHTFVVPYRLHIYVLGHRLRRTRVHDSYSSYFSRRIYVCTPAKYYSHVIRTSTINPMDPVDVSNGLPTLTYSELLSSNSLSTFHLWPIGICSHFTKTI